jgi:hypothetical protein
LKPALLVLLMIAFAAPVLAQEDPCAGFSWNVAHERELFATSANPANASGTQATAPWINPDRLYELQLNPLAQVTFATPPGKSRGGNGPYAGLVRVRVAHAGNYRIALDQPAWIDVVADGQAVASSDYQGRPGCRAPHKVVLFALPADKELLIQLSGTPETHLRLTMTRADAPTMK